MKKEKREKKEGGKKKKKGEEGAKRGARLLATGAAPLSAVFSEASDERDLQLERRGSELRPVPSAGIPMRLDIWKIDRFSTEMQRCLHRDRNRVQ
jgi:hypothetical protein